jgi:hypothetical protein
MNKESKMNKKIAKAWAEDLETTTAPRAMGALKDSVTGGFCCLGRLGLVLKRKFPEILEEAGFKWGETEFRRMGFVCINRDLSNKDDEASLPVEVRKIIGLSDDDHQMFMDFNDYDKLSFKEIAKHVRKNYL